MTPDNDERGTLDRVREFAADLERKGRTLRSMARIGPGCAPPTPSERDRLADKASTYEHEASSLRSILADAPPPTAVPSLLDAIGRVIQEAKHHHAGKGRPLDGPGALPAPLAQALHALEDYFGAEFAPARWRPCTPDGTKARSGSRDTVCALHGSSATIERLRDILSRDQRNPGHCYVEARVGSNNFRGDCVRYIEDRRHLEPDDHGAYLNEPAEDVIDDLKEDRHALVALLGEIARATRRTPHGQCRFCGCHVGCEVGCPRPVLEVFCS